MEISAVIIYMKYVYKPLQINPFSQLPWKMVKPVGVAVRGKKWGAINQSDVVCVDILHYRYLRIPSTLNVNAGVWAGQ